MAIDTKTKRLNMMQFARPFVVALQNPDGVIGDSNRAHLSQWYLVGAITSETPSVGWHGAYQSRVWYAGYSSRVWHPSRSN